MRRVLVVVIVVFAGLAGDAMAGTPGAPAASTAAEVETLASLRERVEKLDVNDLSDAALALLQRNLEAARRETGEASLAFADAADLLASIYNDRGAYGEAEPLFRHALAIRELHADSDPGALGSALNSLARALQSQGSYEESEALYKRAVALEPKLGTNATSLPVWLNNLAALYVDLGRYADAEPLYKRSIALREASDGTENAALAAMLSNVAVLYEKQGRFAEAEQYHARALAIRQSVLGPDDLMVGNSLNNIAGLYAQTDRLDEAESSAKRATEIYEKHFGSKHPQVAAVLSVQGSILLRQSKFPEAEAVWRRVLDIRKETLSPDHPDIAHATSELGLLHLARGDISGGEALLKDALTRYQQAFGDTHPTVALANDNLAHLSFLQGKWFDAVAFGRAGAKVSIRRAERIANNVGQALTSEQVSDFDRFNDRTERFIKAAFQLALKEPAQASDLAHDAFELAQWGRYSKAAQSVNQMAARVAAGQAPLARLVRDRQDLTTRWNKAEAWRLGAPVRPPAERDASAEAGNARELTAIEQEIRRIDTTLVKDFPDYAAVASPRPLPMEDVQRLLREDEALVFFFDTQAAMPLGEETFVWVVSKQEMKWSVLYIGTPRLAEEVATLRCGLDLAAWRGDGQQHCAKLLQRPEGEVPRRYEQLPFDHARAHTLYKSIFGNFEDVIAGKQLVIVPAGSLTQLPFQVLLTEPPHGDSNRDMPWLARKYATTMLPAVTSLSALRRVGASSAATKPLVGFGNPLLEGNRKDVRMAATYERLAREAQDKQSCGSERQQQVASLDVLVRGGLEPLEPLEATGRLINVGTLRRQVPLPETADELCAVAQDLKADFADIHLGATATEHAVKSLSDAGQLKDYRIVHFATHGALAGELRGTAEPGLILTPPQAASDEDDGYLAASEIANLKLDADWVILSACNTAGPSGSGQGAEALSGLARAFFYAQARALLVSHWAVESQATVKLITAAMRRLGGQTGRAKALQGAMTELIDRGSVAEAHPAFWAPFVVVGEGSGVPAP